MIKIVNICNNFAVKIKVIILLKLVTDNSFDI